MTKKNKKGKKVGDVVVAQNNIEVVADPILETITIESKIVAPETPINPKEKEVTEKIETPITVNNGVTLEVEIPLTAATESIKTDKKKRNRNKKNKATIENKIDSEPNTVLLEVTGVPVPSIESATKKKKNRNNKNKNNTSIELVQPTQEQAQIELLVKPVDTPTEQKAAPSTQKSKKNKKNKANEAQPPLLKQEEASLTVQIAAEINDQLANGQISNCTDKLPLTPSSSPITDKNVKQSNRIKNNAKKGKQPLNVIEVIKDVIKDEEIVDDIAEGEFEQVKKKKSQKRKVLEAEKTVVTEINLPKTASTVEEPKIVAQSELKKIETIPPVIPAKQVESEDELDGFEMDPFFDEVPAIIVVPKIIAEPLPKVEKAEEQTDKNQSVAKVGVPKEEMISKVNKQSEIKPVVNQKQELLVSVELKQDIVQSQLENPEINPTPQKKISPEPEKPKRDNNKKKQNQQLQKKDSEKNLKDNIAAAPSTIKTQPAEIIAKIESVSPVVESVKVAPVVISPSVEKVNLIEIKAEKQPTVPIVQTVEIKDKKPIETVATPASVAPAVNLIPATVLNKKNETVDAVETPKSAATPVIIEKEIIHDKQPVQPVTTTPPKQQPAKQQQAKQQNSKKDQKKGQAPPPKSKEIEAIKIPQSENATAPIVELKNDQKPVDLHPTSNSSDTIKAVEIDTTPPLNNFIAQVFPKPAQIPTDKNKKFNKPSTPSYSVIAAQLPPNSPTELPLESSDDETNLQQIKMESERILKQTLQGVENATAEIQKKSDTLTKSLEKLEVKVSDIKKEVKQQIGKATEDKNIANVPAALPVVSEIPPIVDAPKPEKNNTGPTIKATSAVLESSNKIEETPALPPRAPVLKEDTTSTTSSSPKNVEKSDFAPSVEKIDSGVKSLGPTIEKNAGGPEKFIEILDAQMATPAKQETAPVSKTPCPTKGKATGKANNNKNAASTNKKPEVPPRPANLKPSPPASLAKTAPVNVASQPAKTVSPPAKAASPPAKAASPSPKVALPLAKAASPPAKASSSPAKASSPPAKASSPAPAPSAKLSAPLPQTKATTVKNVSTKPSQTTSNGAVKKPDVPPRPANLKTTPAPKAGATAKKPSSKPAAAKEFDSRLQQQDTANKILAFIKTLSSHPNDPSASINSFPFPGQQQQADTTDPSNQTKSELSSKLLDLFLEVNNRIKEKENSFNSEEDMKALLTKDKIHLIDTEKTGPSTANILTELSPTPITIPIKPQTQSLQQQFVKEGNIPGDTSAPSREYIHELIKCKNAPMPNIECDSDDLDELDELEEEEFIEFRFAPREVFIATACFVCKAALTEYFSCEKCEMISYCSEKHRREDASNHKTLCGAIQFIAKKRGGHCYHMSKKLNHQEFRNIRVYTLNLIEQDLQRPLLAFEREILLFPRLCAANICREWKQNVLQDCETCRQVSYCANKKEHLPDSHQQWCKQFTLYHKLVQRQKVAGKIEPIQPTKIVKTPTPLPSSIDEMFKILYKNAATALKDECLHSFMSQIATFPLTALLGLFHAYTTETIPETLTIHLIGAELQFEGEAIEKWETFFLHFVPQITELRVVFIGPEFNNENLPLDIISRIRMCRNCRQKSPPRAVKFDFQCQTFYHDFVNSVSFTKPDLICFFNPGLHRQTGYKAYDTWPRTIKAATATKQPILVTAYTKLEVPLDLERLEHESDRLLHVVQEPTINKFASQRPERNFISDEFAPMIFKNYYYFVVK